MGDHPPRRAAISQNLSYSSGNSVSQAVPGYVEGITQAVAPHTIHFMDCGFMAVNRYCVAKAHVLCENPPETVMDHKIIDLPEHPEFYETLEIIRHLLVELELVKCYDIRLFDPFDLDNKFAIIPVLMAIIKAVCPDTNNDSMRSLVNDCLAEVDIPGKEAIIEATLYERHHNIHLPHFPDDYFGVLKEVTNSGPLFRKYDVIYIRTNRHPSQFHSNVTPTERNVESFIQTLETELDHTHFDYDESFDMVNIASTITGFSQSRLDRVQRNELEKDCSVALAKFDEEVKGFEVQQGGCVVLVRKNAFRQQGLLQRVANAIASQTEEPVSKITFHLLKAGSGAHQLPSQIVLEDQEWAETTF